MWAILRYKILIKSKNIISPQENWCVSGEIRVFLLNVQVEIYLMIQCRNLYCASAWLRIFFYTNWINLRWINKISNWSTHCQSYDNVSTPQSKRHYHVWMIIHLRVACLSLEYKLMFYSERYKLELVYSVSWLSRSLPAKITSDFVKRTCWVHDDPSLFSNNSSIV